MSSDKVLFEEQDDIAIIKLNRPEKRNALDPETVLLFNDYSNKAKDKKYKSVVITGNGGAFCAGADLRPSGDSMGWESVEKALNEGYHIGLNNLIEMDKVVIAAVEGPCAGIGCAYYMSSDIVFMGQSSFFQIGFSKIGLIPDGGSTWLLPRIVGYQRAFRMASEAQRVTAEELQPAGRAAADIVMDFFFDVRCACNDSQRFKHALVLTSLPFGGPTFTANVVALISPPIAIVIETVTPLIHR